MTPKVSIILTSLNHGKYIREAIDSVLAQTFGEFELIIWDDASDDDSWDIINSYLDTRIKAFRNNTRQRGIYGLNKAIAEVISGEYVAIHHSDDAWEPDKLARQIAFLDSHPLCGAIFTNALAIGEDSEPINDPKHYYSNIFEQQNRTRQEWLNFFFYKGNALCHPSALIRKQCYEDCGLYRYGLAQLCDLDMWMRLCLRYEIHVLPENLVRFRVRANEANSSGNRPEVHIRTAMELHVIQKNYLKIDTFEEMVAIFPDTRQYFRDSGFEPGFVLAMVALKAKSLRTQLLGMDLLFCLLGDVAKREKIWNLYGFGYQDLIDLTGRHNVFSLAEIESRQIETTARLESEITRIKSTFSWRITSPLRLVANLPRIIRQMISAHHE